MKKYIYYLLLPLLAIACKAPTYNYYSPAINTSPYSKAGEAHLGFNAGTMGLAAKGGVALSEQVNINALISGIPKGESGNTYRSTETEVSLGFQTKPKNNGVFGIIAGTGVGTNSHSAKDFQGSFTRPFLQLQRGTFNRKFLSESIRSDASFGVRLNYLLYNGSRNGDNFDHNHFFYEPFFSAAIGSRSVRLELIQGFSIKSSGEWDHGVRIFPYFAGVGMLIKLGTSAR